MHSKCRTPLISTVHFKRQLSSSPTLPRETTQLRALKLKPNPSLSLSTLGNTVSALHPGSTGFYPHALKISAKLGLLKEGKQLHSRMIKLGFNNVLPLQTQMLNLYVKCKQFSDAEKLFDQMRVRNLVTWNTMICKSNLCLGFSYFKKMLINKVGFDHISLNTLLHASSEVKGVVFGRELHCFIVKCGFLYDSFVSSALVHLYGECGLVEEARWVFDQVFCRDLVLWNVMVSCYALNSLTKEAFEVFDLMKKEGVKGDGYTFCSLLKSCCIWGFYELGRQVHSLIIKLCFDLDVPVASALRGDMEKVMELLREMRLQNFCPDELTMASIFQSCGVSSGSAELLQVHTYVIKNGFESFLSVTNSLIHAYSKCGNIDGALQYFVSVSEPDLVTWTSIIGAYSFLGHSKRSVIAFEKMLVAGVKPDQIAFLAILSACSHGGLVNEGLHYFNIMMNDYRIIPDSKHYTCLVDLLGRAGLLNEAFSFITSHPVACTPDTLGAFIGACSIHSNITLAKWAAEKLVVLEPNKPVNYTLISNIYASKGRWLDVERVRKMMTDCCDYKIPGCSWVSTSSSRSRNPSSGIRSTPDRSAYSPSFSSYTASTASRSGRNPVKVAARSIAGAFVACFTPPETDDSNNLKVSNEFGAPSGMPVSRFTASETSRMRGQNRGIYSNSTKERAPGSMKFTIEEIFKATRNFSPAFKIGQGGFGTVYKGKLDGGTLVAIKRAKKSVYDKHLGVEFQSEVTTLAQVEHLNLVRFYGYLEHGDERVVVVEYVPNGTLREHLDGVNGKELDFASRLDIAIDVAHAITYLHMYTDHPIIHRDIKSSNILLTEKLRAKVTDFGFARLAADTDSGATHVSTQVKGTAGYLDPEYLRTYQLTEKSDVYSFGVLLVELAMKKFTDGDAISTLDPRLELTAGINLALKKILELALQCLAPRRQIRPSMRRCGEVLWSIRKDFREQSALDFRSLSSNSQRSASVKEQ
ncbi:hypothetical protein GOBAR_DD25362 [Gossypium barbadense]|nr:hypothetical protein GOBAR_DD25362 [Gossypium barbadense]